MVEIVLTALTKWATDNTTAIAGGIAVSGGLGLLFKYGRKLFR